MRKKILWILIPIIAVLLLCGSLLLYKFTNLSYVKLDKSDKALGINSTTTTQSIDGSTPSATTTAQAIDSLTSSAIKPTQTKVKQCSPQTIALFGLDRRSKGLRSRSDVIILLTIDYACKRLKLSSLMRDLYVKIDAHGYTKLNHAYAYGGPQLALKTLNQNFDLAVRDFCTVDFSDMKKLVDAAGGIDMNITEEEILPVNNCIAEIEQLEKKELVWIKKSGFQHLNGAQAVAYSRVRYIGRGDFDRTERQRKVLEALASKVRHLGTTNSLLLLGKVLPYIETSMSRQQILDMVQKYFKLQPMELEENRFPVDGTFQSGNYNGIYYIKADRSKLIQQLHGYLYEDIKQ